MQDLKENAVYAGLVVGLGDFEEPTAAMPRSVGRIKTLVDTYTIPLDTRICQQVLVSGTRENFMG